MRNMPTVLVVSSLAKSLVHFRGEFLRSLTSAGYQIVCTAPDFPEEVSRELDDIGAEWVNFPLARAGLDPLTDFRTFLALRRLITERSIDLVFPYNIKPVIYGSLAARSLGVPVVALITGLGFTFSGASLKARCLRPLTTLLYRTAISPGTGVIFQNPDDQALFLANGLVGEKKPQWLVGGSGVDLQHYPCKTTYSKAPRIKFLLLTRLIEEKGVRLYLEAARALKQRFPAAEFHLVGRVEQTPSAIDEAELKHAHDEGVIVFHGRSDSAHAALELCDVFVLPSFYREGVPRSLIEALSAGLPIITTDTPGCRETVVDSENGVLVPPRDGQALISALEDLLHDPTRIPAMGAASRRLAESQFDVHAVNRTQLDAVSFVIEHSFDRAT